MPNSQEIKTSTSVCVCVWSLIAFERSDIFIALRHTCIAIGFIILEDGSVKKDALKKIKVVLHWIENICISFV